MRSIKSKSRFFEYTNQSVKHSVSLVEKTSNGANINDLMMGLYIYKYTVNNNMVHTGKLLIE